MSSVTASSKKDDLVHPFPNNPRLAKFYVLEKVGEGTYGEVYKATDKTNGRLVALKKIRLGNEDDGVPSTSIREISLLKQLDDPNVVRLYEVIHSGNDMVLVFEYLEDDLKKFMKKFRQTRIDPMIVKSFVYQLIKGIHTCHCLGILHRDLKPQNLLIKDGRIVKLADFGLARSFHNTIPALTHEVVTLWYRPPEILLGSPEYATPVDIWSIGCIWVELATQRPMFPADCEIDQLYKIFQTFGTPDDTVWPGVSSLPYYKRTFPKWSGNHLSYFVPGLEPAGLDLLTKMFIYNPADRISAKAALNHPYFDDLDKSKY